MELNLQEIRTQLDQIDDQMTALFAKRMNLVTEVAAYKKEKGLPILDTGREREIVNRVTLETDAGRAVELWTGRACPLAEELAVELAPHDAAVFLLS